MISRIELERLIVMGLKELRQAERDLARRFKSAASHGRKNCQSVARSLAVLKAKAEAVEELLGALDNGQSSDRPAAA
jgi:hypothetical protein